MKEARLTLPELALIGGTRGLLGAGLGLLLADRLSSSQRKAIGWTLFTVGVVITLPLAAEVLSKLEPAEREGRTERWENVSRMPVR